MLTATLIRDSLGVIVGAHQAGIAFRSWWDETLSTPPNAPYTICIWHPPDIRAEVIDSTKGIRNGFGINIELRDRVEINRTDDDRDAAHAKMAMYAMQLFAEFVKRYVKGSTVVNGQTIDLKITEPLTMTNFWDEAPNGETGVTVRWGVAATDAMDCASYTIAFA